MMDQKRASTKATKQEIKELAQTPSMNGWPQWREKRQLPSDAESAHTNKCIMDIVEQHGFCWATQI